MPPLTNRIDNFLCSGPFLMSNSGNGSHGQSASYAFGFVKKYLFFQKLQPKTFCSQKSQTRFFGKIFSKNFWNFDFQICEIFDFHWLFNKKKSNIFFFKNQNFWFFEKFFEHIFSKKSWVFLTTKSFRL